MQTAQNRIMSGEVAAGLAELLLEAKLSLFDTPAGAERCINRALCLLSNNEGGGKTVEQPPAHVNGGLAPWQIRRLEALIESRLAEPIRTLDLAASVRLSSSHFSRAFVRSFGVPPHAHVVGRRIAHAKHLIETTSNSLCEIALACGLADQAHLSRAFRRVVGQTPKAWRRNCINPVTQSRPPC